MTDDLPAGTRIRRVDLRVRSLTEAAGFYGDALGFRFEREDGMATVSAGRGPVSIGLKQAPDAPERAPEAAELYHVAVHLVDREALGATLARLRAAGQDQEGAADHVASEALYPRCPDGNGVELYTDRPRDEWESMAAGAVRLPGDPLGVGIVEAAAPDDSGQAFHPETDLGHVHLQVTDLDGSESIYRDMLGFRPRRRKPRALFLAGGDHHHHVAINTCRTGRGPRSLPIVDWCRSRSRRLWPASTTPGAARSMPGSTWRISMLASG